MDKEDKIRIIREQKWINYSDAVDIIKELNDLKSYPKSSRMPNILLVGDSNNGKTALIEKFISLNPATFSEENSEMECSVVAVQAPPEPDERRFYNSILEKLLAPYKISEKLDARQMRVKNLLKKLDVKILIIDEIHHVLAGAPTKQRKFLNVLKFLSNELKISLICAGTKDAFNAIQTDPQLSNRFSPRVLKRWGFNNEYKRLLLSFESKLPLKEPSHFIEDGFAQKILALSEGLIGEISKVIELSAIYAIENNFEKVTPDMLDKIRYVPPSDRKKVIYKL
ncbi:TniB family NTP-binding protein [Tenacibaculum sp. Mcav3-52]|uniref:TniB family NTP-binding protein n=1 Tax=Tenacibaculum sp. Mcav3-52 TaxID=2917762 RepID=UPI001EF37DC3|nr:TniB family NTP-binding protein [Tenacibaculum sp. Mcav3-52]MCG7501079.1 TniB family NTP-binding protein [Tenacibaculum sp. Mcav3-52]